MIRDPTCQVTYRTRDGELTSSSDLSQDRMALVRSPMTQAHNPRPIRGSGFMSGWTFSKV